MTLETTRLSSKGPVIIKPRAPFADTTLAQVAGCLHREGRPALSQDDIDAALQDGTPSGSKGLKPVERPSVVPGPRG